jgi:hypothetical protein
VAQYLTRAQYAARTGTLEADSPSDLDLRLASSAVDSSGPFVGTRRTETQVLAFPRTVTLAGDIEGVVPDDVLDAVAVLAGAEKAGEEDAAVKSESVLDASVTYATATVPRHVKRADALLFRYRLKSGRRI